MGNFGQIAGAKEGPYCLQVMDIEGYFKVPGAAHNFPKIVDGKKARETFIKHIKGRADIGLAFTIRSRIVCSNSSKSPWDFVVARKCKNLQGQAKKSVDACFAFSIREVFNLHHRCSPNKVGKESCKCEIVEKERFEGNPDSWGDRWPGSLASKYSVGSKVWKYVTEGEYALKDDRGNLSPAAYDQISSLRLDLLFEANEYVDTVCDDTPQIEKCCDFNDFTTTGEETVPKAPEFDSNYQGKWKCIMPSEKQCKEGYEAGRIQLGFCIPCADKDGGDWRPTWPHIVGECSYSTRSACTKNCLCDPDEEDWRRINDVSREGEPGFGSAPIRSTPGKKFGTPF